jgi:hypothetical protein
LTVSEGIPVAVDATIILEEWRLVSWGLSVGSWGLRYPDCAFQVAGCGLRVFGLRGAGYGVRVASLEAHGA